MNIQQIKYVLAVVEYRHFELAAEKCFVTQSTLSTMISKFEDEIGIKIFDRKKKPVEVTNEGITIIEQLKIINKNIFQLDELVKEIKGELKGTLSISVIPTVAPFLLPLFLQNFANKFPDLKIEVREETTKEIIQQVKHRELDIGIISIPVKDSDLIEVELYNEPFIFYDAGLKYKKRISVQKIALQDLWLMEEDHCMRTQVLKICDSNKEKSISLLNFDFKAGSIDSLLRFVRVNKACTLLPYLSILDFPEREKNFIKYFFPPVPLRTIGLIVHQHFVKKKILDLLKAEIQSKVKPLIPKALLKGDVIEPI